MEQDQPTLADILAHPLVLLLCTTILTMIGWFLTRQVKAVETAIKEHEARLDSLDRNMWKVNHHLWPNQGPGSPFQLVVPPKKDSSA